MREEEGMSSYLDDGIKVDRCIKSCVIIEQLNVAGNLVEQYARMHLPTAPGPHPVDASIVYHWLQMQCFLRGQEISRRAS
jgi:hypothetical protein